MGPIQPESFTVQRQRPGANGSGTQSAIGAMLYQPSAKRWDWVHVANRRAESPIHRCIGRAFSPFRYWCTQTQGFGCCAASTLGWYGNALSAL
jgi:hypothetical protein